MSSCFGRCRKGSTSSEDQEPLIAQYEDDTVLQKRLHQKLHTYQMLRALGNGFMPSNEQLIINLRTLLASDVLNADPSTLSDSGRLLVKYTKRFVQQFLQSLQHKNDEDQIQDFIWCLTRSRLTVDASDLSRRAAKVKAKADTVAAYRSLQTVGTLLLTNSDFRIFLSDLQIVGKEVFKDSAFALSRAANDAGQRLEAIPEVSLQGSASSAADPQSSNLAPEAGAGPHSEDTPTQSDLKHDVHRVSEIVEQEAIKVGSETKQSLKENLSPDERQVLVSRLKKVVLNLREHSDYKESISTLSLLIQRFVLTYSRAAEQVVEALEDDVDTNAEMDLALKNFFSFVRSFGDPQEWDELQTQFEQLLEHQKRNPEFESFMSHLGRVIQDLLTNPASLDQMEEKLEELRKHANSSRKESSLRFDVDRLLNQIVRTWRTFLFDKDIEKLVDTALQIFSILSPSNAITNPELVQDAVNVFVPQLINAIQYLPIPRLEVSTPDIDLLLENLVLEPGETINQTSFLPYRFKAETYNDLEIRRTHTLSTASHTTSFLTLKVQGLTLRAEEIGYLFHLHSGLLLRMRDQGLASFALDSRGIDIALDIAISPPSSSLESILTLKKVRVKIHKLSYELRKSRFSILAFLLKPILRPILRRALEAKLAAAIADFFHAANRELVFARERLRATRISDPDDLLTFFKAVLARLVPPEDEDVYTRVGLAPLTGPAQRSRADVFRGVYAPGSIAKVWEEQGRRAKEQIDDWKRDGWRNDIFDVIVDS